jgi:hypothetical protein
MLRLAEFRNGFMTRHRLLARTALGVVVTAVLVVHGYLLYRIASHVAFAVVAVLVIVLLVKHVGLFGSVYAAIRRRSGLPK